MRDQSGMSLAAAQLWPCCMLVARCCPQRPRAISAGAARAVVLQGPCCLPTGCHGLLCGCWWHCSVGTCPPACWGWHWDMALALGWGLGTGTGSGIGTGTWHRNWGRQTGGTLGQALASEPSTSVCVCVCGSGTETGPLPCRIAIDRCPCLCRGPPRCRVPRRGAGRHCACVMREGQLHIPAGVAGSAHAREAGLGRHLEI